MFKGILKAIICVLLVNTFSNLKAQSLGFVTFAASYDTVWNLLQRKKIATLDSFVLNDSIWKIVYTARKKNADPRLVEAFYNEYILKVNKGYKKVFKLSHKKSKKSWNYRQMQMGNTKRQAMGDSGDLVKISIAFSQKKRNGELIYYLWKVNSRWYLIDKMKLEEIED